MTVSELAKRAGVTAETVRHYTRSGFAYSATSETKWLLLLR